MSNSANFFVKSDSFFCAENSPETARPTAFSGKRQVFGDRQRRSGAGERILEDATDHFRPTMFGPASNIASAEFESSFVDEKRTSNGVQ